MDPCPTCHVAHEPGDTCAGHEAARRRQEARGTTPSASASTDAVGLAPTLGAEERTRPAQPGTLLDGRYRLEERVGAGGMGEVYRATDTRLGKTVAVKRVIGFLSQSPEILARFQGEIRSTVRVDHPNVVDVLDKGQDAEGRPYFVLEFLEGRTLRDVIKGGRLSAPRALKIADQLLRGLAKAHRQHVLHRDLKPANIMLVDDGTSDDHVKILDFGIAKALDDAASGENTRAGYVMGTPSYMAPEVVFGGRNAHPTVDVYAVGVILYEMLAGASPFSPSEQQRLAAGGEWIAPPSLRDRFPDVPEILAAAVDRAMHPEATSRFQSAEELRGALLGLGEGTITELAAGTVIDDRYKVVRTIGSGGTAVVYLADEARIGRRCALKFLVHEDAATEPTLRQRFFQDAALAARIEHPGVVRIFATGEWRGHPYIAMEYVDADTLRASWSSLPWARFVDVVSQVAAALEAVHDLGVVHRDVTPENVVIDARGGAKLLDFGIARLGDSQLTISALGYVIGRYGYIAPEQAFDPRTATSASDQWSLAAVVYEALTGRAPYCEPDDPEGPEANELICQRLHSKSPPPDPRVLNPTIPRPLADAVLRALSDEPGMRFASVQEFAAALVGFRTAAVALRVEGSTPQDIAAPGQTQPAAPTIKLGRRRGALVAVLAIAATATALAVVAYSRSRNSPTPTRAAIADRGKQASSGAVEQLEAPKERPPAAPLQVAMTIDSRPAGGVAIVDGKRFELPVTLHRATGAELAVRVERRGYRAREVALTFGPMSDTQIVELTRDRRAQGTSSVPDEERQLYLEPENRVKRPGAE